jgi:hypothetical protein
VVSCWEGCIKEKTKHVYKDLAGGDWGNWGGHCKCSPAPAEYVVYQKKVRVKQCTRFYGGSGRIIGVVPVPGAPLTKVPMQACA